MGSVRRVVMVTVTAAVVSGVAIGAGVAVRLSLWGAGI